MRTARLVGPTADGTSVVLVTDDGEELQVLVAPDDPLARALRAEPDDATTTGAADAPDAPAPGRRPPRRRETPPMDTSLSPRDIQTRIRAGESLEDLVASSGMDAERIERFAAPVLAEREHMALTALGASVRRRGEGSGHRPLRTVVAERLLGQGVDADDVVWDAWKRDDNQWQVSADFALLDQERHAEFRYDPQGRFSLADDDDARWLAGERPSPVAAVVDRDDELALVRATSELDDAADDASDGPDTPGADQEVTEQLELVEELAAVLTMVPPLELSAEELEELVAEDPESDLAGEALRRRAGGDREDSADSEDGQRAGDDGEAEAGEHEDDRRDEAAEPTIAVVRQLTTLSVEVEVGREDAHGSGPDDDARSALDTLYDMLGGDGYAEESTRAYAGLTDAAAVPVVDEHEFEPPTAVRVPAEPGPEAEPDEEQQPQDAPADAAPADDEQVADGAEADVRDERTEPTCVVPRPGRAPQPPAKQPGEQDGQQDEQPHGHDAAEAPPVPDVDEPLIPSPGASRKPGRRKRASVPSWDEIMFGGPKPG